MIHFSALKTCHFGRVYFNRLMLVTLKLVFWIINDYNCIGSATLQISCIFGTLNEGEGQPGRTDWSPPVYVDAIRRKRCREKDGRHVRGRGVLGDRQGLSRLACINPEFDSQSPTLNLPALTYALAACIFPHVQSLPHPCLHLRST